ncbi:MAG: FixH family protein [Acidobacteriota bacterium]
MKPEVRWPLFIIGLLVLQVGLGVFFFLKATSDPSFAVEEDYYQKAVNWEDKQAQDRKNTELGWTLEHSIGTINDDQSTRTLTAELIGRDSNTITGATVRVETFHNVRAGEILRAELQETGPGHYEVRLPMLRPGLWEIRFTAELGSERFTHTAREHVVGLPGR